MMNLRMCAPVCVRERRGKGKVILVVSKRAWSFPAFMEMASLGDPVLP